MQRKRPLHGKIFARCILQRRFAGHFGCMARTSCQSQLISDAWRADLATKPPFFSRPRPLLGYMERKTCHGLPPGNAPRRNLATVRPPRTHCASILPLPVRPRAHQGAILPPSDAGKRISRAFCHRRTPGDASRHNLATTGRPRRTLRAPMRYDTMRHDAMRRSATTPCAATPRCHAPYAALLSPLKK